MSDNKSFLVETNKHLNGLWGNGKQKVYQFPNGYGASVIPEYKDTFVTEGVFSREPIKGLWEVAVLYNDELCYSSPLTDDVIRSLNDPEVDRLLFQIRELTS
jgi:hypothetical protein